MKPIYETISSLLIAVRNCEKAGNAEWLGKHRAKIQTILDGHMPSGSGIDTGTIFQWEKSTPEKLVFTCSYHHMDESGGYDGWTDHTVTVRASLWNKLQISISGKDRNQIKEYLHECYSHALEQETPKESI